MDSKFFIVIAALAFVVVFSWLKNRPPCLNGMSLEEAKNYLATKYPNHKLRNKIGFVEPETGKAYMLGKIAKIDLVKLPNDEVMVDYTLYQIDTGKIADYSKAVSKSIAENPASAKNFKQFNDLQSAMKELASLGSPPPQPVHQINQKPSEPKVSQEQPVKLSSRQVSFQEPVIDSVEKYPIDDHRDMSIFTPSRSVDVQPPKGLVNEVSLSAPKTSANRLRMSIPDRESNSRSHFSKESFFW